MLASGFKAFDCSVAVEYQPLMMNLRRVSEQITLWLVMAGIGPDRFYTVIEEEDDGFEFGFRIDYSFEDDFAEVGREFWQYVSQLVPLREPFRCEIQSNNFDPLNTISTGPNNFLLMIQPDLSAANYEFPPQEFWSKCDEDYRHRHDAEWTDRAIKERSRPMKLIASNGHRLDSPS